jgi:hypothetical protein
VTSDAGGAPARWLLAVTLLLLATACELRADVGVRIDRDGAGELAVSLALDEELAAAAAEAGLDPFDPVVAAAGETGAWRVERVPSGVTLTTDFATPEELTERSATLAQGLAAAELEPLEPFAVTIAEGRVTVQGAAGLMPTRAVTELGVGPERALEVLAESVDYEVRFALPGEIVEASPGAVITEQTVSWRVPAGQRLELLAVARRPPRVSSWTWWAAGASALLLAAVVAYSAPALASAFRRLRSART